MIRKGLGAFALAVLVLLLTNGCESVNVKTATDPGADFRKYHTFNFKESAQGADNTQISQANRALIQDAIRQELEKRGFALSPEPDLWATWYLSAVHKVYDPRNAAQPGDSIGATMKKHYGFMYGNDANMQNQQTVPYHEGTLVIALVDRRTNQAVWEGLVSDVLDNHPDKQSEKRIRDAVAAAFRKFPKTNSHGLRSS